jgi:ribonuclease III
VVEVGVGELKNGGFRRQSILADALEAVIGAVFLDQGLDAARALVLPQVTPLILLLPDPASLKDPKTRLQEWLQAQGESIPEYRVVSVGGDAHAQSFVVECLVAARGRRSQGEGSSRRRAEQQAAAHLLAELEAGRKS